MMALLVTNLAEHQRSTLLERQVIQPADNFKLKVIAEGVQTSAQLGLLEQAPFDEAHGYFFTRPIPAAELAVLLAKSGSEQS